MPKKNEPITEENLLEQANKMRDIIRDNFVKIKKLTEKVAELESGGTPRKRYIEAEHRDSLRVEIDGEKSDPVWSGLKTGVEIDADISGKELAAAVKTQFDQARYFVKNDLKQIADDFAEDNQ